MDKRETVVIAMEPEEAVAMALCHELISNHPGIVKAILEQHQVQPSTDPVENILKLARLSAERGRYFNEDFARLANSVGYGGAELMPDVLSKYVAKFKDLNNLQAGYFSIRNIFQKKDGGSKFGNMLRDLFKKDTPTVAPGDAAATPAATDLAAQAEKGIENNSGDDDDDEDKDLILGMKPWLFYTGLGFVLLLLTVIIILWIRAARKNKEQAEKK